MYLHVSVKTVWSLLALIVLVGCVPNTIPSPTSANSSFQFLQADTPTDETYIGPETDTPEPYVGPGDTPTNEPYVGPGETATSIPNPGAGTSQPSPSAGPTGLPTSIYPGPVSPTSPIGTPSSQPPAGGSPTPLSALTGTPIPGLSATRGPNLTITSIPQPIATSQPPQNLFQTVTIWHSWSPAETKTLEDVVQSFQSIYPNVKFVLTYVPLDELQAKYDREAYLGNGPSLLLGPAEWGPAYYDKGLVADLGTTADAQFLATINPAALNEAKYKGALIGLPYAIRSGVVMYRNKAILPKAPETFAELVSMSKAVTHGGTVGAYLEWSFFYAAAHLDGMGGQLMDQNGDPSFNSSLGVEWLKLLNSFKQAGPTEFNGNRDLETFKSGKAGIIIDGTWNKAQLVQAVGSQNLAIDPWPAYQYGHLAGFLQTDNIYLNANFTGDQRYAALQFMGFFLAREVQAIMTRAGHIPAVMDIKVDDPFMQEEMEAFKGAVAYPVQPEISAYWDPLQKAMLDVVNNSADPVTALQQAYQASKDGIAKMHTGK